MTEFWQSQAKKFCDLCKCWITDNKPSIEFHERGKKHKENVAIKIKEVHKKGKKSVKDNDELKRNLQEIEKAALEAYKKDVGEEEFIKDTQKVIPTVRPVSVQKTYTERPSATNDEPSRAGCSIVYNDGHPVAHCSHGWTIAQSPEGYYYYYNSQNMATQWEVPVCLDTTDNVTGDEIPEEAQSHDKPVNTSQKGEKEENRPKLQHNESQEAEDKSITVKSSSPYGAWTTVRTIETPSYESKNIKDKNDKIEDEESEAIEDPEITAKKTENKFRERELPKISFDKADDQVVGFKKRKLNNERKRNIRQTKFN